MTTFKPVVIQPPKMPASTTNEQRESKRTVAHSATLVDEVDAAIRVILDGADAKLKERWAVHNNPVFDNESQEGSVTIDKVRLADMVKAIAKAAPGKYPLIERSLTRRVELAVGAAQRRTHDDINERRRLLAATTLTAAE
jgi:hypothetical protein